MGSEASSWEKVWFVSEEGRSMVEEDVEGIEGGGKQTRGTQWLCLMVD